jgi:CRISPR/Cas system-associated exonuclease Cas4 (RecB family)
MNKFLQNVASYLLDKYKNDLSEVTVVFPNRRAGLFFQKYISQLIEKPLFSPQILTITDLVSSFSDLKSDDNYSLVVDLWETFTNVTSIDENIDDFFYWGEMLLSDFNDIDKYLVDAQRLFKNIESLKEIDLGLDFLTEEQILFLSSFWKNMLEVRSSADKNNFLNSWNQLFKVYTSFREKLKKEGRAYEGMVYRGMVDNLELNASEWESRKMALIGFNALNNCEKKLFRFLKKRQTDFFWDYDQYYLSSKYHEASFFMVSNLLEFPMPSGFSISDNNFLELKNIDLIAVPGFSGQAVFASHWLNENKTIVTSDFDNTAIVLCDESLLTPMLNSLPQMVGEVNITMGFPLKNSPVFSLLKGLIDIDRNSRKNSNGILQFYYRNVLALLNHPLLKTKLGDFPDSLNEKIQKENKIYLNLLDLSDNELLISISKLPENAIDSKEYFQKIVIQLFSEISEDDKLTKETLYQFYLLLNRVHDSLFKIQLNGGKSISKKLFYQLLLRSTERLSIPFEGEPLCGMQIMGFLETRCLDFENLIILSFNDDKLPGNPNQHSFIPYSLRKGFDLPVIEHRNAMYSYYFYRLIQRAKHVTLVYDSRTDGLSRGEVSRYATQIKYEAKHLTITEKQAIFNFDSFENQSIDVVKKVTIQKKLESVLTSKIISPTMLNTYIDCKLKFYFRYVDEIRESDEVFEEIDPVIFGRIAHLAMEGLYKPYLGRELSAEDIRMLIADKKNRINHLTNALKKEFFKGGSFDMNGKNLLIFDILEKYLMKILQYDLSIVPFTLLALEKEYTSILDLTLDERVVTLRLGGTIDRLDQTSDFIRVVDYKTGKSDVAVKSIESLFLPIDKRNKAAFQTMLYAHSVYEQLRTGIPIVPSVYGARSVFMKEFNPIFRIGEQNLVYQNFSEEFKKNLSALFTEIFNPEISFSQTDDEQKCKYCPYNLLCNREG